MTNSTTQILKELRQRIEQGAILVKVATTQGGYKETQLMDNLTGYKLIPEHIVPRTAEAVIKHCELCKAKIDLQQVYTTKQIKGSETILYYHSKCRIKEGTTSSDKNWDGNISNE